DLGADHDLRHQDEKRNGRENRLVQMREHRVRGTRNAAFEQEANAGGRESEGDESRQAGNPQKDQGCEGDDAGHVTSARTMRRIMSATAARVRSPAPNTSGTCGIQVSISIYPTE